ncbi:hypothetical protein K493DRAFT_354882 [Basidiobolus meristosporus CBS 931.73]|uniref:Phosphodiester glycosidase domain-containing protein n=1 Tax=Basidiobolus meristosporus CBS 931.73 TaxID=1314790 RepID=A0A1Y1Y245_9FUNG|nr:hypothetical protein K493DRAFT_354882 [Basidiobolus meristosporus CBS 931.73]|eukprot:ORX92082.1 hypothetical protein K493DRAFT_354882 [Basidiobolus meristosporus CBS 931.73]
MTTTEAGIVEAKELSSTAIISDIEAVGVAYIGEKSVANSGRYGINGGFFNSLSKPAGELLSITYFSKGETGQKNQKQQAGNGSSRCDQNGKLIEGLCYDKSKPTNYTRGTMICHQDSNGALTADVAVIRHIKESKIEEENIQWAIGGYSLHLDKSYTDHEYMMKLYVEEHACSINEVGRGRCTHRSALGFRRTDGKMVLASFRSCSVLEVRNAMKHDYQCDIGIMLDGGGSSQISGVGVKTDTSKSNVAPEIHMDYSFEAQIRRKGKDFKGGRAIYSMVTVNPDTWVDVSSLIVQKVPIPAAITIGRRSRGRC